jgi:hypothetical protein
MAEIVDLRSDENPPARGDWLLVCRNSQGQYETTCSKAHQLRESNFYLPVPNADDDLESAVARAVEWGKIYRFSRVFVRA